MNIALAAFFALLGLFVGSFLNVCIDRLPRGQSIISPPSHCPACSNQLSVMELIPVFSFIWLRGKCRRCGARIPARVPLVEAVTAVLFLVVFLNTGMGLELVALLLFTCVLIIIFVIDLERQLILDKVTYPAMGIALILAFFRTDMVTDAFFLKDSGVEGALLGGLVGLGIMALIAVVTREGMGWGDVKLAGLIGLMIGFPYSLLALLLSWIGGGVLASILLVTKLKKRKDKLPFGSFMAVAAFATMLWWREIAGWLWW